MTSWRRIVLGALVAALVAALAPGCAEEERPRAKWHTRTELPADFPQDLPIYPAAKLQSAVTRDDVPVESGAYLSWSTSDDIPAVRHFYTAKLDEQGWHVVTYPGVAAAWMGEGGVTIVGTKWGRTAAFALGAKDGTTLISLVFPAKD